MYINSQNKQDTSTKNGLNSQDAAHRAEVLRAAELLLVLNDLSTLPAEYQAAEVWFNRVYLRQTTRAFRLETRRMFAFLRNHRGA